MIQSGTQNGVTAVTAALPLTVTGTTESPNVESNQATTTDAGHVARLATSGDVSTSGTGSTTAVVTADLLKETNVAFANLDIDGGSY